MQTIDDMREMMSQNQISYSPLVINLKDGTNLVGFSVSFDDDMELKKEDKFRFITNHNSVKYYAEPTNKDNSLIVDLRKINFIKYAPFPLNIAQRICEQFQYLKGKPVGKSSNYQIKSILVSPYDENNKQIFLEKVRSYGDQYDVLEDYDIPLYDVLLVYEVDTEQYLYRSIRDYIKEYRINYLFPNGL